MAATSAAAQERIEVIRNFEHETVFQEYNVGFTRFGERGATTTLPSSVAFATNWVPLAGGRYLIGIFHGNHAFGAALVAFDRRTRSIAATLPTDNRVGFLMSDPIRPRLFYTNGLQIIGFDATTLTSWTISPNLPHLMVYAPKVDRLYLLAGPSFADPNVTPTITVVNATSGAILTQFPTSGIGGPMAVDSNGRRLYKTVQGPLQFTTEVAAYDAETGQEVARAAAIPAELVLDESRGLLFGTSNAGDVTILDAASLAVTQQVTVPRLPGAGSPRLSVRPGHQLSAAHVVQGTVTSGACWKQSITTFNTSGGARGTLDLSPPAPPGPCSEVVLLEAPASPSTPTGSVAGSAVHLLWENPGNVSEFELQVGFASGTTAVSQRVGLQTSIGFANVPPGTYYVRVRAINELGTSAPSPEIAVTVQ